MVFGSVRINAAEQQPSRAGEALGRPLTGKGRGAGDTSWRAGRARKEWGKTFTFWISSRRENTTHVWETQKREKHLSCRF